MHVPSVTILHRYARRDTGLLRIWSMPAVRIWRMRELVWQLFRRDFLGGHRKSFLGMTWLVIHPLLEVLLWMVLQMTGLLRPGPTGISYGAYAFLGIALWNLFTGYYHAGASVMTSGRALLLKVNYPQEIMLAKQVLNFTVTFAVRFVLLVAVLTLSGTWPGRGLIWFPLVALPVVWLGTAIGLLAALLLAVSTDAGRVMDFVLRLMMLTVPLIYSQQVGSPFLRMINRWNPLTYLLCSCRDMMLYGRLYHAGLYAVCAVGALLVFLAAWRAFYMAEKRLVERML